ncbi:ABC transporter permease subunit [Corynebacterium aquilae]|uniref:ABC transporter permease subunit n=1 Tax=Corynebacterium aquilae TaxID=203263 RepID=UPI000952CAE4|nr:ABC transporter permease subunit [Corynebacterium aquilae]
MTTDTASTTRRPLVRWARQVVPSVVTSVLLLAAALLVAALLPWIGHRDPAMAVFRAREAERAPDPQILQDLRVELNLPTSPWESITQAFSGHFGTSWVSTSRSATEMAWAGLATSATLAAVSTAVGCVLAFVLAVPRLVTVVRGKNARATDITAMAVLGSIPEFVLAVVLLVVVGLRLAWQPVTGMSALPVLALAIPSAGLLGRVLLITIDTIGQEAWVASWRINGVNATRIARAITVRSIATMAPLVVLFFAGTLASTVLVENTFGISGFGRTALTAATNQDIPVLQVVLVTVVAIGIVAGAAATIFRNVLLAPLVGSDNDAAARSAVVKPFGLVPFVLSIAPLVLVLVGLLRPLEITTSLRLLPPSVSHPLGTDQLGRDMLARLAHGAVYTIGAAVAVTAVCALVGLVLGLSGRWASRVGDALNALPAVLIGLVLAGIFGGSLLTAACAVVLVGWIPLAAHAATVAQETRATGYVRWAETMGASRARVVVFHLLPTVVPATVRHAASRVAHNALALAGLGFLGLGAPHDSPEWGVVLSESIRYAERAPWVMAAPTVLLIALGVAAALATDTTLLPRRRRRVVKEQSAGS